MCLSPTLKDTDRSNNNMQQGILWEIGFSPKLATKTFFLDLAVMSPPNIMEVQY